MNSRLNRTIRCIVYVSEPVQELTEVGKVMEELPQHFSFFLRLSSPHPHQLIFVAEFAESPYVEGQGYAENPSGQAAQLLERLVSLDQVIDFELEYGEDDRPLVPISGGGPLTSSFGSAEAKGWAENMPEDEATGRPDFLWNHKKIRFPEAIDLAIPADPGRGYPGLDTSKGKDATNIKVFQIDTGWTKHPKLVASDCYLINEGRNFVGAARGGKDNSEDSLKQFAFPAPQAPGHGTATAHTVIGNPPQETFSGSLNEIDPDNHPNRYTNDLGGGLFPYVNFIPLRVGNRVVLNFNSANSSRDVLEAVKFACSEGADVITMSMGGDLWNVRDLHEAADFAYQAGVLFVCAAGNSKIADFLVDVVMPAQAPGTIAVAGIEPQRYQKDNGAIEFRLYPWQKSCDGPEVDVSAPAKYIYTAFYSKELDQGAYKLGGATSQATAHVAAAAALWKHYFQAELSSQWYQDQPSRAVDAFKWGLKHSNTLPAYWVDPSLDNSGHPRLKKAKDHYKGILNVEFLLSEFLSPAAFEQQNTFSPAPLTSANLRMTVQNPHQFIFNCQPSPRQEQDWQLGDMLDGPLTASMPPLHLNESVDLREGWWAVGHQGRSGSCVGWATADSLLRWHLVKAGRLAEHGDNLLSVRFVWMAAKETDEFTNPPTTFLEASGTSLKAALDILRKYGCVEDAILPFDSGELFPGSERNFYSLASQFKIRSYYNLQGQNQEQTVMNWKSWLSTNGPILTRVNVDRSFYHGGNLGHLQEYDQSQLFGGHAIALVGYTQDHFIIRNSWGTNWGDGGFAYASYRYAMEAFTESYGILLHGDQMVVPAAAALMG